MPEEVLCEIPQIHSVLIFVDRPRPVARVWVPHGRIGEWVVHDQVHAARPGFVTDDKSDVFRPLVGAPMHHLTAREIQVISLVAAGNSNNEIGTRLSLSALTVKNHLARIGRKLGAGDRARIVTLACRAGIVD